MHLKLKAIKFQEKFLKYLQSILLVIVLFVLIWQLSSFNWKNYSWSWPKNSLALLLAILLVGMNWFFEWLKWKHIVKRTGLNDTQIIRNGFYAGMVTGFITPSAFGNFIGRMALAQKQFKAKILSFSLFANGAQFIVSLFFGLLSVIILTDLPFKIKNVNLPLVLSLVCFMLILLYFTIQSIPFLSKIIRRKAPSFKEVSWKDKSLFIGYSLLRYLVFSFQFYLVIIAFQPEMNFMLLIWVWHVYLWTTLSPSLVMGKLFIRESIAVFVLSHIGIDAPVALITGLLIWSMNNVIPSLFAYFKWKKYVLVKA